MNKQAKINLADRRSHNMIKIISEYYIENGKLYCKDNVFAEPYEVECTVGAFLDLLEMEETI